MPAMTRTKTELRHSAQQFLLLGRKSRAKAFGLQHCLALLAGSIAQAVEGLHHHLAAVLGQLPETRAQIAHLLLLLRSEVLESLHPFQDALLFFRRQSIELAQALAQFRLLFRIQAAKLGIIFQGALLLLRRHVFVTAQPVTGVRTYPNAMSATRHGSARTRPGDLVAWRLA